MPNGSARLYAACIGHYRPCPLRGPRSRSGRHHQAATASVLSCGLWMNHLLDQPEHLRFLQPLTPFWGEIGVDGGCDESGSTCWVPKPPPSSPGLRPLLSIRLKVDAGSPGDNGYTSGFPGPGVWHAMLALPGRPEQRAISLASRLPWLLLGSGCGGRGLGNEISGNAELTA